MVWKKELTTSLEISYYWLKRKTIINALKKKPETSRYKLYYTLYMLF